MAHAPDVMILGGGVIGLTTALFLRRAGVRVAVLDKGEFGQESSWAGAGIIPSGPAPDRACDPLDRLASLSGELHPRLSEQLRTETGIDNGYLRRGGWELFAPTVHVPSLSWRALGIVYERVEDDSLSSREPALTPGSHSTYYLPGTAQVRNPRHLKALLSWCGHQGVDLLPGCPVHGFERAGSRITAARTAGGLLPAGQFLLASGAWSESLLEPLGFRPGIHPVRGQIALLNCSVPLLHRIVEVGRRYLVPRPDGRVLVGSTEENAGFEKRTTTDGIAELLRFALSLAPGLAKAAVERCWAGLRPGNPDGKPFLGGVPGIDNLFVAAGHFRNGIQLSCATGQVMTELLLGRPLSVPLEAFSLTRCPDRGPTDWASRELERPER